MAYPQRKIAPLSAPASRTSFRAQRFTVPSLSALRNSVIAESPDSEDEEDGQYATIRDDESIPSITIQSASSYKGSPATARKPAFVWEQQISQSIDQQLAAAPAIAHRGELARLAAARRMAHNRRSMSMYLPSETPATPPLSPPNDGYSSLASPMPFTSAISPNPFMAQFAAMGMVPLQQQMGPFLPMMPMTAAPMRSHLQHHQQQQQATQHRRSASYGRKEQAKAAAALPSLDEIRVLFEKRKAAAKTQEVAVVVTKPAEAVEEDKKKDEEEEKKGDGDKDAAAAKPKEETDRERRASGLKLLKRRSLALQTDVGAVPSDQSPRTPSPVTPVKPQQLSRIVTDPPAIKVEEPLSASATPKASPATRRRPMSLQVPKASDFAGLPAVERSPVPPTNLLAIRGQDRSQAARKMLNRLSLSNRVVLAV